MRASTWEDELEKFIEMNPESTQAERDKFVEEMLKSEFEE